MPKRSSFEQCNGEIYVLVKFSPKRERESMLGEIKDNVDVEVVDENELHAQASIPSPLCHPLDCPWFSI